MFNDTPHHSVLTAIATRIYQLGDALFTFGRYFPEIVQLILLKSPAVNK